MEEFLVGMCAARGFAYRHELLAAGLSDRYLTRAVRGGLLMRLRHGTYAVRSFVESLSAEDRHVLLARSVLTKLGDGVVLSHHSAAILHTGVSWDIDPTVVHVTRLDGRSGRAEANVRYHVGRVVSADEICDVGGLRSVVAERAVAESASISSLESGLVVASFALRQGSCTRDDLSAWVSEHARWPGMLPVRLVVRRAEPRCESVGEVRSMHLFTEFGIPRPEPQMVLADADGEFGRSDFGWPEHHHIGEFDGLIKYGRLNPHRDSLAGQVLVDEKRREDRARALDLGVSRWGWVDLSTSRRASTAARILAALTQSQRRRRAS